MPSGRRGNSPGRAGAGPGRGPRRSRPALNIIGIIPARYGSTRLPGKPLADINGQTLIERVWRRAIRAKSLSRVLVATDDGRIAAAVAKFGGEAVLTPKSCPSGTDRLAVVARRLNCDVVVNIQGDEPFLAPASIDRLVSPFFIDPDLQMATLSAPLPTLDLDNPGCVKVVCNREGYALYFSRAGIPFVRSPLHTGARSPYRLHLGMYAYRRRFLLKFARWPRTPLEKLEQLEQLRALEHGVKIRVLSVSRPTLSVDTPEDLAQAVIRLRRNKERELQIESGELEVEK
jgi:3-deoxy-manno-octulosonate cytidylyltransferase (CMP-KDO synthetase)